MPQPSAWTRSVSCWFWASLSLPALATLRILPRSGRIAWFARLRACFAEPPAESPSTMKISEPSAALSEQSASLPGSREFAAERLARDLLFLAAADALVGALDHPVEELVGLHRIAGEPVIERVLDRALDDARRLGGGEPVLGLALEFRLADEHREHRRRAGHHVFARHRGGALALADALGMVLERPQQRAAQAGFMGAAVPGRNGVAIGGDEAVGIADPGDRPFDGAVGAGPAGFAGENVGMDEGLPGHGGEEVVLEAVGEVEASPPPARPRCRAEAPCRSSSGFRRRRRDRPWRAPS